MKGNKLPQVLGMWFPSSTVTYVVDTLVCIKIEGRTTLYSRLRVSLQTISSVLLKCILADILKVTPDELCRAETTKLKNALSFKFSTLSDGFDTFPSKGKSWLHNERVCKK